MQKYIFSADKNAFFPVELKIAYQESGEWPDDGIEIDDTVAAEFMKEAPEGKYRGVIDGMPAWIDIHRQLMRNKLPQPNWKSSN